jgi:hypothetical protein
MDDTKEIGAIGADTLDISSIPSLSISDLDSMLTTSITGAADTLTMIDPLTLGNVTISSGSIGAAYTLGAGTASNAIWTTGIGTNTIGVGQQIYTIGPNTNPYSDMSAVGGLYTQNNSGKISIRGEKADIDINGKSMLQWMQQVEERLNILVPNPELEKEWDDLRRLGERYRKLEKKCKEKAEMWKKLKSMPKPEVN